MLNTLNTFSFDGRASRSEFWLFQLFCFVVGMGLFLISMAMHEVAPAVSMLFLALLAIFVLGTFVQNLALSIRRLHDINVSGWWWFICFLPLGGLVLLVMYAIPGTSGDNKYGRA